MFRGEVINELVALLERRGVSLYHACQYADFCAYLAIGGIPSRALLERSNQVFTAFVTDKHDRQDTWPHERLHIWYIGLRPVKGAITTKASD